MKRREEKIYLKRTIRKDKKQINFILRLLLFFHCFQIYLKKTKRKIYFINNKKEKGVISPGLAFITVSSFI